MSYISGAELVPANIREKEEGAAARIRPEQLLEYIQAANQEHFEDADTAVGDRLLCCDAVQFVL